MANNCTPNIQALINDVSKLGRYKAPAGAVELAMSQSNGAEVEAKMVQKNGKNSVYSITYVNSTCETPVSCDSFSCSGAGTDDTTLTTCTTFDSFSCKSMPAWRNLPISSLRDLGSASVKQVFSAHLWDQMQSLKSAIDVELVTAICTAGEYKSTVNLLNALGAPNYSVEGTLQADFADAGFGGVNPLLLGNRQTYQFGKAQGVSGLADSGLNLGQMQRFATFYDNNVVDANCAPDTAGNEVMMAILPSLVNHISWSENAGMFASRQNASRWDDVDPLSLVQEGETYLFTTIEDPATGMLFDLNIVFEPKCKKFQYQVKTYYKHLILPATGCASGTFTGIHKYDVCPAEEVVCGS